MIFSCNFSVTLLVDGEVDIYISVKYGALNLKKQSFNILIHITIYVLLYGAVVYWLSLLHNFVQLSLNSDSACPARGMSEIRDGEDI